MTFWVTHDRRASQKIKQIRSQPFADNFVCSPAFLVDPISQQENINDIFIQLRDNNPKSSVDVCMSFVQKNSWVVQRESCWGMSMCVCPCVQIYVSVCVQVCPCVSMQEATQKILQQKRTHLAKLCQWSFSEAPRAQVLEILEGLIAWAADTTVLDHGEKHCRGDLTSDFFKLQSQGNLC